MKTNVYFDSHKKHKRRNSLKNRSAIKCKLMTDWINGELKLVEAPSYRTDIHCLLCEENQIAANIAIFSVSLIRSMVTNILRSEFQEFNDTQRSKEFLLQIENRASERLVTAFYSYLAYEVNPELLFHPGLLKLLKNPAIKGAEFQDDLGAEIPIVASISQSVQLAVDQKGLEAIIFDFYPTNGVEDEFVPFCREFFQVLNRLGF